LAVMAHAVAGIAKLKKRSAGASSFGASREDRFFVLLSWSYRLPQILLGLRRQSLSSCALTKAASLAMATAVADKASAADFAFSVGTTATPSNRATLAATCSNSKSKPSSWAVSSSMAMAVFPARAIPRRPQLLASRKSSAHTFNFSNERGSWIHRQLKHDN
jgi:hypothetical protein